MDQRVGRPTIWFAVLGQAELAGGFLAPKGRLGSLRYRAGCLGLSAAYLALGAGYVIYTLRQPGSEFAGGLLWWLVSFLTLLLTLLAVVAVMLRRRAVSLRGGR